MDEGIEELGFACGGERDVRGGVSLVVPTSGDWVLDKPQPDSTSEL